MDKDRITLGRGVSMATPFSNFCMERGEGNWGERGGGDNRLIQVEMGILHRLGKEG